MCICGAGRLGEGKKMFVCPKANKSALARKCIHPSTLFFLAASRPPSAIQNLRFQVIKMYYKYTIVCLIFYTQIPSR